jgi:hypothetical protein
LYFVQPDIHTVTKKLSVKKFLVHNITRYFHTSHFLEECFRIALNLNFHSIKIYRDFFEIIDELFIDRHIGRQEENYCYLASFCHLMMKD